MFDKCWIKIFLLGWVSFITFDSLNLYSIYSFFLLLYSLVCVMIMPFFLSRRFFISEKEHYFLSNHVGVREGNITVKLVKDAFLLVLVQILLLIQKLTVTFCKLVVQRLSKNSENLIVQRSKFYSHSHIQILCNLARVSDFLKVYSFSDTLEMLSMWKIRWSALSQL